MSKHKINWDDAQPHVEDMVAVLLSTLHPEAERIDGSGGDGGRDIQIRYADHTDLYEVKSFTGRLGKEKNRRRQVERSLANAAKLKPATWTLIVPIDHTPAELEWFDGLRKKYDFPLTWRGKTWLEKEFAKHPSIARYYLEGASDEVVQLLKEVREEEAGLVRGVPDAVKRLERLRGRLNELDPFYELDISVTAAGTAVAVRPRYRGAENDRPIIFSTSFQFPDTPMGKEMAQKVKEVIDFGETATISGEYVTGVNIDAPAGMGGKFDSAMIKIGPATSAVDVPMRGQLIVSSPVGIRLASVPLRFRQRRLGTKGGTIEGGDLTGSITVALRFDMTSRSAKFNLAINPVPDLLPGQVLTVLKLGHHMVVPNCVQLLIEGVATGAPVPLTTAEPLVGERLIQIVSDLERLQTLTATAFTVPDEFTPADQRNIRNALTLLDGGSIILPLNNITPTLEQADDALIKWVEEDVAQAVLLTSDDFGLPVGEELVPLGPAMLSLSAAHVGNREEILALMPFEEGVAVPVVFIPDEGVGLEVRLGGAPGSEGQQTSRERDSSPQTTR